MATLIATIVCRGLFKRDIHKDIDAIEIQEVIRLQVYRDPAYDEFCGAREFLGLDSSLGTIMGYELQESLRFKAEKWVRDKAATSKLLQHRR